MRRIRASERHAVRLNAQRHFDGSRLAQKRDHEGAISFAPLRSQRDGAAIERINSSYSILKFHTPAAVDWLPLCFQRKRHIAATIFK
jgi:hypothetical protein